MAKAINFRVVVKVLENPNDIYQSPDAKAEAASSFLLGKVKEVGYSAFIHDKYGERGTEIHAGDLIYITPYAGRLIPKRDGSYERILNDCDVQGIVEEDDDIEAMLGGIYE